MWFQLTCDFYFKTVFHWKGGKGLYVKAVTQAKMEPHSLTNRPF